MTVTDVLRDRMHEPAGLQWMAAVSMLVHGAAVAAVILAPTAWFSQRVEMPRQVMTISLGGTPGPETGGFTSIGGRAVQVETPPELVKRPEPVRPPAAKAPEMTVPERGARARTGATNVTQAPADARGRTPTRGAEPTPGSTIAETGVRGQGFGLSTGGGAGSGSRLDITGDFCCPEYVLLMLEKIRGNWDRRVETSGQTIVKYTIQRDGTITDVELERSSGTTALDLNAQRAIYRTRQFLPLPPQFPNPTLTVHLNFEYTR